MAALQAGLIQSKIAAVKQARDANLAKRRDVLTGASEFPNLNEAEVAVDAVAPLAPQPAAKAALTFAALAPIRLADAFERLRDRSDALLKSKGQRPAIFLANLGTAADFTARATFARSFAALAGTTPRAMLTRLRMDKARTLLRTSTMSLNAVALEVGYESPAAFSRAFRQCHGEAPGRYRHAAD